MKPPKIDLDAAASADARDHHADQAKIEEISPFAYPPYPKTKTAYYEILQRAINKAKVQGYNEGRETTKEHYQEAILNKLINALCKVSTALAERKY